MRPKSAHSCPTTSQFERKFGTQQTFKRNQHYIDVNRLNSISHEFQIKRRQPLKTQNDLVQRKINSSFMNSTAEVTEKLDKQIDKYKSRVSSLGRHSLTERNNNAEDSESSSYLRPHRRKMTSRAHHDILLNKPQPDEKLFNNFKDFKPSQPLYCDIDKKPDRDLQSVQKNLHIDLQYNTQKLYSKYYYSKPVNKVDYRSQKKLKHQRVFFKQKRPEDEPATILKPEQIEHARKSATKNTHNSNIQFYRDSGRQQPPQLQLRFMNELTDYWTDVKTNRFFQPKLDYYSVKMNSDLQNARKQKIHFSKKAEIKQQKMCAQIFYRRSK